MIMEKKLIVKADMSWQCSGELFEELKEVVCEMSKFGKFEESGILISGFNIKYKDSELGDFGFAIKALKQGKRVVREGWNGKGMFLIHIRNACQTEIRGSGAVDLDEHGLWAVNDYIGMKTADDEFVPWLASQTDMLAEDWTIL